MHKYEPTPSAKRAVPYLWKNRVLGKILFGVKPNQEVILNRCSVIKRIGIRSDLELQEI